MIATAAVYFGAVVLIFCLYGAAAERWLIRRDHDNDEENR